MALTSSISINVPALPDNDVWFANAAAWSNYWNDISGDVEFNAITNPVYVPVAFVDDGAYVMILEDGTQIRLVKEATLLSLKEQVAALDASYQLLRTTLRNAGFLTHAQ